MSAMISATEIMAVQDGIRNDMREDGRTLLQRRPVEMICTHGSAASGVRGTDAAGDGEDGVVGQLDQYAGSRVETRIADTVVLAASTPSVVEIAPEGALGAEDEDSSAGHSHEQDPQCRGQLFISIDAAPHVVDYYARAMGGRGSRYRRSFLSYLAYNVRSVFGAESVSAQEQLGGVVEAQLVDEEEADDSDDAGDAAEGHKAQGDVNAAHHMRVTRATGFPAKDLYIGKHFAFRIDVDVHVLEAGGGNLLTTIALAVHAALASCQLPSVVLHNASTGSSVSVEVDKSKPYARTVDWSQLPMLCVLHVAPTRHYLVDATTREALALPQQLHVAATSRGLVAFTRYQQWPSRKGGRLVARAEVGKTSGSHAPAPGKREREPENGAEAAAVTEERRPLESAEALLLRDRNVAVPAAELPLTDFLAAVNDAVHICQSMIADCHSKLGDGSAL